MPTLFGLRGERLQTALSLLVVVPSFLAMGFSLSFLGGVVSYQPFYSQFPRIDTVTVTGAAKSHNALIQGTTVSTLNLGAAVGCFACMWMGNKLGRRWTTAVGAAVALVGTVLQCSAFAMGQLVVSRVVLGAGLGIMSSTVPVWQAETSKTHRRGHHVIVGGICIAAGVALASWLTFGFSKIDTTSSWRWRVPCATTGLLSLCVLLSTFFFPESPRWLALKSRLDQARTSIAAFDDVPETSESVEAALASIVTMNDQATETASVFQLFRMGPDKMRYRLILAASTQLFSQMGGSGLITYYAEQLFSNIGLSHDLSKILGATDLTWKVVCSFIPFFVIEMAGRRRLFMISGAGMSTCLIVLAICGSQTTPDNLTPAYVAAAFAFIFVIFYPFAFLGVNWLYSQEVISTPYRAPASGVSTAVHWLSAFVVALTTPLGFNTLAWKFYFVWAAVALSIVPSVYFFYPETTGLSMEEIDEIFRETPNVLATVRTAEKRRRRKAEGVINGGMAADAAEDEWKVREREKREAERQEVERV